MTGWYNRPCYVTRGLQRSLVVSSTKMTSLLKGVLKVFTALTVLRSALGECHFENEHQTTCSKYINITFICTGHIDIESIHNLYSSRGCYHGYQYMTNVNIILRDGIELEFINPIDNLGDSIRQYEEKIKSVDVSFTSLTYIPPIVYEFKQLERLNCSNNQLTSWTYNDFLRFLSLQKLDLSYNELDSLEDDTYANEENAARNAEFTYNGPPRRVRPVIYIKLVSLILKNNKIQSIPKNFFRNFNNLETLDLSYNKISSLDPTTFNGIGSVINYLDISHNSIMNLNHALIRLSSLMELHINNNEINTITVYDFAGLDALKTLTLNDNHLNSIEDLFNSMVSIETLNFSHNEITKITKDSLIFNKKLTIVDMSYNIINAIERGAFKNNSLITVLEIEGNQLHGALKGQLEGLTQLKTLNMSHHKLSRIEDFAFLGIQDLSMLNISNNILTCVSKFAFKTLINLKALDLSNNFLTESTFDTTDLANLQWISLKNNTLSALPSTFAEPLLLLEFFDISENKIKQLASNTFKSLHNLKNFFVGSNPLTGEIVEKTFHNLESLPSLDLSHTNISHLQNDSFNGMKTLFNFNISYSNLSRIEYNTFRETGSVLVLDASHNRLEFFSVNNSEISLLVELDLSHNLITLISSDTLANLNYLKMLYLSHNKLSIVEKGSLDTFELTFLDASFNHEINLDISCVRNVKDLALSGNANTFLSEFVNITDFKLKRLSLSSAHVTDLETLKLFRFTKLETLQLSSNDISMINNRSFHSLPNLQMLNLHSNKISFIQTGSFKLINELMFLNLSHNEISTLEIGIFFGIPNLLTLDLSYNKIRQINTHILYGVPLLSYLIIDSNYINTINFEEFMKTKVTTISLGDNPLHCNILTDHKNRYLVFSDKDPPPMYPQFKSLSPLTYSYRHLNLIALSLNYDRENVDGITCKGDMQVHTSRADDYNMSMSEFVYNSEITNKLLEEIKILLKTSQSINQTTLSSPPDDLKVNKEMVENMTNATKILTETMISSFPNRTMYQDLWNRFENIQTKIYKEMKKENSHVNDVLNYLFRAAVPNNVTTERQISQEGTLAKTDELTTITNNTSDKERLKNELKELLASERQNIINDIKDHFEHIKNDTLKNAELRSDRLDSASIHNYPANTFTDVCVGIILAIVLGFVVYKIYNTKKVLPTTRNIRSTSTQEISNTMEM